MYEQLKEKDFAFEQAYKAVMQLKPKDIAITNEEKKVSIKWSPGDSECKLLLKFTHRPDACFYIPVIRIPALIGCLRFFMEGDQKNIPEGISVKIGEGT